MHAKTACCTSLIFFKMHRILHAIAYCLLQIQQDGDWKMPGAVAVGNESIFFRGHRILQATMERTLVTLKTWILVGQVSETPKHRGCLKWQPEMGSISVCQILTCNIRTMVFCWELLFSTCCEHHNFTFPKVWSLEPLDKLLDIPGIMETMKQSTGLHSVTDFIAAWQCSKTWFGDAMFAVSRVCAIEIYVNLPYFGGLPSFGLPIASLMVRLRSWLCTCVLHGFDCCLFCVWWCTFGFQHFAL